MKFGVPLFVPAENAPSLAEAAEELGFESAWVGDHVIWPAEVPESYPYAAPGAGPHHALTPIYDPWVTLAGVASRTTSLKLATYVYVLPMRNPFVTARAVATLDQLSGGRVICGVGVGWMREEFTLLEQDFDDRGPRSEEIVALLRRLWTGDVVDFNGRFYQVPPVRLTPPPPQGSTLPVHIGGESRPALARAARCGDGWLAMPHDPDEIRPMIEDLRRRREEAGLDPATVEVTTFYRAAPDARLVARYEAAGVDRMIVKPWRGGAEDLGRALAGIEAIHPVVQATS